VASNQNSKAEAEKKRGNQKDEPAGEKPAGKPAKAVKAAHKKTASKKTASKKTASKKTASKKTASKKTASKKTASKKVASGKTKAVQGTRTAPAKGAAGKSEPGRQPGKQRTIPVPAGMKPGAAELDPFEVAKQRMKGSVPAIVEAMVERAKKGSCSHAKTLLEMTGAKHMFGDEMDVQDSGEPWAKLVLERMDEAEQESLHEAPLEVVAEP
jgi:hypothetical protein